MNEEDWQKRLSPEQYRILRCKGTEQPGSGEYNHFDKDGTYLCAGCGSKLFDSATKYDSGCGWPAFYEPKTDAAVTESEDMSTGSMRTEITCSRCGGHLGHVFEDGPGPKGLRYCMNSVALKFDDDQEPLDDESNSPAGNQ